MRRGVLKPAKKQFDSSSHAFYSNFMATGAPLGTVSTHANNYSPALPPSSMTSRWRDCYPFNLHTIKYPNM